MLFEHFIAGLDDQLARQRINDILSRGAAQNSCAERSDDFARIHDGTRGDEGIRAAIGFRDDGVLRHVDETAGEVARVCRLERGVGQTLTGAVGGVEVLQHGEAFLEVRDDRRFDDLTRWLGHEAAHTSKLLHLGR